MKTTQVSSNPYPNSDTNKRYYTYDHYLKKTFGGKCMKIPLDAGFTCPNIDGKCSVGGCIYCSSRGSGDFAADSIIPVDEQFEIIKNQLSSKWKTDKYIPYFQAHTNTYAPLSVIREKVESVMTKAGVVALNIATRADCLEDDVVEYLASLAERTVLTVELGLQTAHDSTAFLINRGHSFEDFLNGYYKLRRASSKINVCVHLIFGLPGESREMMLDHAVKISELPISTIKLHQLQIIKDTPLAALYKQDSNFVKLFTPEEYAQIVADFIRILPGNIALDRFVSETPPSMLIAPSWGIKPYKFTEMVEGCLKPEKL